LIGHSEGAKTCAILAAEDPGIAAIALLAGATAVNVDSLLLEQARSTPEGPAPRLLEVVRATRSGAHASGPGDLTDWVSEHLEVAPRDVLARIRCPVLILQGGSDHLVPPHHAGEAAAVIRAGGNGRVTVRIFPGLSHVFNHSRPGVAQTPDERRVDPVVASTLAVWLKRTLAGAPR
jgi:pimeloyl-ACP methyl ester carboxylesterase